MLDRRRESGRRAGQREIAVAGMVVLEGEPLYLKGRRREGHHLTRVPVPGRR